jgi:CHAD domain-containing protein
MSEVETDATAVGLESPAVTTTSDLIANALGAAVERFVSRTALLRSPHGFDDPENVHQARVGIRRFRSLLRTFRPVLDREWNDDLRARARVVADALGRVRDADVISRRLRADLDDLPRDEAETAAFLVERSEHAGASARAALVELLGSQEHTRFAADAQAAAHSPKITPCADGPARETLAPLASEEWRRLRKAVRTLEEPADDARLHRVRILTKRVRYAADALRAAPKGAALKEGKRSMSVERFTSTAASLQDALGELHDAVVCAEWLRDAAARATGHQAFVAGKIAELEILAAATERSRWHDAWKKLDRKRNRKWLRV